MQPGFSCFHYMGAGQRCGAECPEPLFFCATHLYESYTKSPKILLQEVADSLVACTMFTETGLPSLSCRDFERWGVLCNSLAALTFHGYRNEEDLLTLILSSLLSKQSPWKQLTRKLLPKKGRTFEILVARLYLEELAPLLKAASTGGQIDATTAVRVLWDQRITSPVTGDDRQVDVVLRWHREGKDTFTAVECKDQEVEVGDVEAFVTKIGDLGAETGVLATSVGFQSGALNTARAHDIVTRIVREEDLSPETTHQCIYRFRLRPTDIRLVGPGSSAPASLEALPQQITVVTPEDNKETLDHRISRLLVDTPPVQDLWPPRITLETPDTHLQLPDGRSLPVTRINVYLALFQALEEVTLEVPRHAIAFCIHERPSGLKRRVEAASVPVFATPTLAPGRFYANLLCQRYWCRAVEGDTAQLVLLADRQHGKVLDIEFVVSLEWSYVYYLIEDTDALRKLDADLDRFLKLSSR